MVRLDVVLRDCARAVQYLRHRAEALNIDVGRKKCAQARAEAVRWDGHRARFSQS